MTNRRLPNKNLPPYIRQDVWFSRDDNLYVVVDGRFMLFFGRKL